MIARIVGDDLAAVVIHAVSEWRTGTVVETVADPVVVHEVLAAGRDVVAAAPAAYFVCAGLMALVVTSFALELIVYPAIYEVWKWNFELKKQLS